MEDVLGGKRRGKDLRSSQSVFLLLACFRNRAPAHYWTDPGWSEVFFSFKKELGDSWRLMRVWLQCFVLNKQTRIGQGWDVCNEQSFWPVEKCFLKVVCMYSVAIARQSYCECHCAEKFSHLNISTHSHFLTLSVKKLQNFPIIPFWIWLALRGRRDGLYQSFAKLLLSLSLDIPASSLKHTLSRRVTKL